MSLRTPRTVRIGATLVAGSVAVSFAPLFPGAASAAPANAPSIAGVCANAGDSNPFTDIGGIATETRDAIDCLFGAGLVSGVTPTTFQPNGTLTRQQGAALIARLARAAVANQSPGVDLAELPRSNTDAFTDDAGSTLEQDIDDLAAAGIVRGTSATTFDPTGSLTRGQFASLVNRLQAFLETGDADGGSSFDTTENFFDDDEGSVHEDNLNALASQGILRGDGGTRSTELANNLRSQAALVIARHAAVNFEAGNIGALPSAGEAPGIPDFPVTPDDAATIDANGERTFTATGLDDGAVYRVTLVTAANVTVGAGGAVSFTPGTNPACGATVIAAPGPPESAITAIDGDEVTPTPDNTVGNLSPTDGAISVTATGTNVEDAFFPVFYVDDGPAGGCTFLEIDGNGNPTEAFGVGGLTEVEAPDGLGNATEAPELTGVSIDSQTDDNVVIRYSFDEDVDNDAPDAGLFNLYTFNGELVGDGTQTAIIPAASPSDVLVSFDVDRDDLANVSVATVDTGAVSDSDGRDNVEGAGGISDVDLGVGTTVAPDLVSVGGFNPTTNEVDFVFDEPVESAAAGQFQLAPVSATDPLLTGVAAEVDNSNRRLVRVTFDDITDTQQQRTARGIALAGATVDPDGNANPLQAVDVSNGGITQTPDLVDVTVELEADNAWFEFDVPVQSALGGDDFTVYNRDGVAITPVAVTRSAENARMVVAQFAPGQLDDVVGASVGEGQVTNVTGVVDQPNDPDQVVITDALTVPAGLTTGPDLLSSRVEQGSVGGVGTLRVVYTFDEAVAAGPVAGQFSIYDDDADIQVIGTDAVVSSQNPNEVFVTFGDDAAVDNAVIATVDDGAVSDNDVPARTNVEGYTIVGR